MKYHARFFMFHISFKINYRVKLFPLDFKYRLQSTVYKTLTETPKHVRL